MDFGAIITTLLSGLAGGNIAGAMLKKLSLGPGGNSIAGIVGGFLAGPAIANMANPMSQGGAIFSNIAGSGIGGGGRDDSSGTCKELVGQATSSDEIIELQKRSGHFSVLYENATT